MEIDVVILSYAKDSSIVNMNNNCINSINNSSDIHTFNIILVETEASTPFIYNQKNVTVIQPGIEFGYNKYLNIGISYCKNEWILISNNDTIYERNFIEHMLEAHEKDKELLSMCPIDDNWEQQKRFDRNVSLYYGYTLKQHVVGWSIFLHRKVLDILGPFDEYYRFWYQDNDYINMLIKHKIKHALVTKSKVNHLLSKSSHMLKNWTEMVVNSETYFNKKWNNVH